MLLAPGGFLRVARKYFSTTAQQETQTVGESPHIIALRFRDQPPENFITQHSSGHPIDSLFRPSAECCLKFFLTSLSVRQ
jgi:hypothetical protein